MLADLWNAADPVASIGTSTVGSSEECMLGGLALKRRWQHDRRAGNKPTDAPNIVPSFVLRVSWATGERWGNCAAGRNTLP